MEKVLEQIKSIVKTELLKRGFNVEVCIEQDKNGRINIETSDFQTQPVLFKNIWIRNGFMSNLEEKHNELTDTKFYEYKTKITAYYECFGGGFNANDLFAMTFRWFNENEVVHLINII